MPGLDGDTTVTGPAIMGGKSTILHPSLMEDPTTFPTSARFSGKTTLPDKMVACVARLPHMGTGI